MPNHVHLVLVPSTSESLSRSVSELHRSYTQKVNRRNGWTGCLWQGRYFSFPMDEHQLLRAVRYVLLNPVRAGLVENARDWPYSSVRCHINNRSDGIVDPEPLAQRVDNWSAFLAEDVSPEEASQIRFHQRTGRPLGDRNDMKRLTTSAE